MSYQLLRDVGLKRVPVVLQSEAAECGLACIAMVAAYHGHETTLRHLRRKFDTSLRGVTLKRLIEISDKLGFSSRALQVSLDQIDLLPCPAIIHWRHDHFVVMEKVNAKGVTIIDPSAGRLNVSGERFSQDYTGVALELTPNSSFKKKTEKDRLKISQLWDSVSGVSAALLQLVVCSLALQLVVLINPLIIKTIVDEVIPKSSLDLLVLAGSGFVGLAIINAVILGFRSYIVVHLGSNISFQVASNLFRHLLSLPTAFFEKRHMGDIVSRFRSIEPIKLMLTEGIIGAIIDGIMAVTTFVMMLIFSPLLTLVPLGALILYFCMRMIWFRRFKEAQETAIDLGAKENTLFMESVTTVIPLKLFGMQNQRIRDWRNLLAAAVNSNALVQKKEALFEASKSLIAGLENILCLSLGALLVIQSEITLGVLFAFLAYRSSFNSRTSELIENVIDFRMLSLHLDRLADLVETEPEQTDTNDGLNTESNIEGAISISNVSYKYSSDTPMVLNNVTLDVEAGQSVAIVGKTGCGKSTLFKIMIGLFNADQGHVLIDGKSVASIGLENYRRQIGVVMQNEVLFTGTLADNIALFDANADYDRIERVARQACIWEDIQQMPMKLESLIGDMGTGLSGGQLQRISIARALYRNPKILFMDEGTSHLDIETEAKINSEIKSLGITRVLIAHRPETIRTADRVVDLNDLNVDDSIIKHKA